MQERAECFLPYATDGGLDPGVQELLKALAHEVDAPSPADGESSIPAGFTYLENLRTPALDLDSLYGRGPLDQPYLYQRVVRSDVAEIEFGLLTPAPSARLPVASRAIVRRVGVAAALA